jgi:transcriptional regulator with XRE-family HTH domain
MTKIINIMEKQGLARWLEIQYIEWMRERGEVVSQREFAEYLGLDQVQLSHYLNARRKNPDPDAVAKMADKLGPEVYDILGLARPDPQLQELTSIWHKLDKDVKDQILQIAEKRERYQVE